MLVQSSASKQKRLTIGLIIKRSERKTSSSPTLRASRSPNSPFSENKKRRHLRSAGVYRAENETRTRDPNLGKVVL
ncbi:hypothetical protein, partial [uncultured Rikenella sp.]|uniref:hypothetical protein n=1 Tax=uncultured Rikenella sp. TaxID=368003 RepID=UPI002729B219